MKAASKNQVLCAQELMDEAKIQNAEGYTALAIAAEKGNIGIVQLLQPLEGGIKTNKGMTPLMLAVKNNKNDCA